MTQAEFDNRIAQLVARKQIVVSPAILKSHGLGQWGDIFDAIASGVSDAAGYIADSASTILSSGAVSDLIQAAPSIAKLVLSSKSPSPMPMPVPAPQAAPQPAPTAAPAPYSQQYPQQIATQQLANVGYYFTTPQSQQLLAQALQEGVYAPTGQAVVAPVPPGAPSLLSQMPAWIVPAGLGFLALLVLKKS
jgi:hypothetical protein